MEAVLEQKGPGIKRQPARKWKYRCVNKTA